MLRRAEDERELPAVLGFYTLTLGEIARAQLPHAASKKLPRYPVPVVSLARLAVDKRVQGRRIGASLLGDAHLRALAITAHAGAVAMVVDAKDGGAEAFYRGYEYRPLEQQAGWPRRLFLPIAAVRKALLGA